MALADDDGYSGSGGGTYGGLMTGDSTIVWGPHKGADGAYGLQHGEGYDVLVYCNTNKYDAALLALGYDMDWINENTTDLAVRGKLSSSEYGGMYYTIVNSNTFRKPSKMQETYTDPTLCWGDGFYGSALGANNAIFGANYIYYVRFTEAQRLSARNTIRQIVEGGGNAGGSNEPVVGGSYTTVVLDTSIWGMWSVGSNIRVYDNASFGSYTTYTKSQLISLVGSGLEWEVRNNEYNWLVSQSQLDGGYDIGICSINYSDNYDGFGHAGIAMRACRLKPNTYTKESVSSGNKYVSTENVFGQAGDYLWSNFYKSGDKIKLREYIVPSVWRFSDNNSKNYYETGPFGWIKNGTYVGPVPPAPNPPPDWPEPDPDPLPEPQPDPPDVPDVDIDVPITGPTYQVITNNTSYVTNNNTTAPNVTIDLQGVIDAMNEHCIHLQTAINGAAQQLNDNLGASIVNAGNGIISAIDDGSGYIVDTVENEFVSLKRYLKELFEWLSERMDFDIDIQNNVDPFDDSSIIAWLKRIWAKMGNDPITKPPIDTDPTGFWDWLTAQLQKMIDELLGLGGAALNGPTGILEELLGKFPFSVPWDVAALLALLVAEPVAPVFDLPLPTAGAVSETHQLSLHIDLTWLEPAVTATKFVELVAWAMWLVSQVPKWLNDIKVDDVLG